MTDTEPDMLAAAAPDRGISPRLRVSLSGHGPEEPFSVLLFVIEGFSMMALSSIIEPLRAANRLSQKARYSWSVASTRPGPIRCSNGLEVTAQFGIDDAPNADFSVVVASLFDRPYPSKRLMGWLRRLRNEGRMMGAVSNATLLLADAGVLGDRSVAVHWEAIRELRQSHSDIVVSDDLYCWDRGVLTAAGGTSSMDMVLALIAALDGDDLAIDVADQFLHGPIRQPTHAQRNALQWRHRITDPRLATAVEIMKNYIAEPARIFWIAERAGLSERHLERLFLAELGKRPSEFYMDMRLRAARSALISSTENLETIAENCGFSSPGHFSRAFKARFGETPSTVRKRRPLTYGGIMQEDGGVA
ncbi:GlxA family transcriptional regulator [Leisingera daeponensis]|uniref:GlxA family transcriptional regulator n=1 Tax=Leisingera daeponensis TaxID=405746 RepID=A0ABS7NLU4_9RHOB|nr:GlxA family transcriptional regulator [Leisingera daeponensis]MBY6142171.1 GlxA family transcriptional regulator [Leisingera daeponensis]